jgi:hypothetical protein
VVEPDQRRLAVGRGRGLHQAGDVLVSERVAVCIDDDQLVAWRGSLSGERLAKAVQQDVGAGHRLPVAAPLGQREAYLAAGEKEIGLRRDLCRRGHGLGEPEALPWIVGGGVIWPILLAQGLQRGIEIDEAPAGLAARVLDTLHDVTGAGRRFGGLTFGTVTDVADEEEVAIGVADIERGERRRTVQRLAHEFEALQTLLE